MAAGQYDEAIAKAKSKKLRKILEHNKNDEINDHAARLEAYSKEREAKEKHKKLAYA
ncbi:MAG: hypothetical protein QXS81_04715 [Candidatus Micrarchaeaceae archaeon]